MITERKELISSGVNTNVFVKEWNLNPRMNSIFDKQRLGGRASEKNKEWGGVRKCMALSMGLQSISTWLESESI